MSDLLGVYNVEKAAVIDIPSDVGPKVSGYISIIIGEMVRICNEKAKLDKAYAKEANKQEVVNPPQGVDEAFVTVQSKEYEPHYAYAYEALVDKLYPDAWRKDGENYRPAFHHGTLSVHSVKLEDREKTEELIEDIVEGCFRVAQEMRAFERLKEKTLNLNPEPISHFALKMRLNDLREHKQFEAYLGDGFVATGHKGGRVSLSVDDVDLLSFEQEPNEGTPFLTWAPLMRFHAQQGLDLSGMEGALCNRLAELLAEHNGIPVKDVVVIPEDELVEDLKKITFDIY